MNALFNDIFIHITIASKKSGANIKKQKVLKYEVQKNIYIFLKH